MPMPERAKMLSNRAVGCGLGLFMLWLSVMKGSVSVWMWTDPTPPLWMAHVMSGLFASLSLAALWSAFWMVRDGFRHPD